MKIRGFLLLVALAAGASGYQKYQDEIPNGKFVTVDSTAWPGVGHSRASGGGSRNQFGVDFAAAGHTWTKELCEKDSDGDGVKNGVELGDPNCVWTKGQQPAHSVGITHPGVCNGDRAGLVNDPCENFAMPGGLNKTVKFRMKNHALSTANTIYDKQLFSLSELLAAENIAAGDQMAFKFSPYLDKSNTATHHMILYGCEGDKNDPNSEAGNAWSRGFYDNPSDDGNGMPCTDIKYAWAVGGKDFCTPENVGFTFDKSMDYYLLEVHYDNPAGRADWTDASGVDIMMVPSKDVPSATKAGFIWLGTVPAKTNIPARQSAYEIRTVVDIPSTVPKDMFNVFAFMVHGHKYMRQAWSEVKRENNYVFDAACSSPYDYDLQEFAPTKELVKLSGGDRLTTRCIYDTSESAVQVKGGDATSDEMCIVFLMYYPLVDSKDTMALRDPAFSGVYNEGTHSCGVGGACGKGSSQEEGATAAADTNVLTHGVLMALAWCLLLPSGVAIAALRRAIPGDGMWFKLHRLIQLLGVAATIAGFALAVNMVKVDHFAGSNSTHKALGLATVILALLQPLNAVIRPHKDESGASSIRRAWEWWHKGSGYAAVAAGIANCILGALAVADNGYSNSFAWIAIGVCGGILFLLVLVLLVRRRAESKLIA